jgi:hypothetical protein
MVVNPKNKKYFTPAQANAMLPLVRSIVKDICELAHGLRDRRARLNRLTQGGIGKGLITQDQLEEEQAAWERDSERLQECVIELSGLGVEMKDLFTGLVDFPGFMDGREVCLCWKLGEPRLDWWHETSAGFAGRQRLKMEVHEAKSETRDRESGAAH